MECESKQVGTSGVMEQVLFGYPSPPEAQGKYVIYSPEIYCAAVECVLKDLSMCTLRYCLNLCRFAR